MMFWAFVIALIFFFCMFFLSVLLACLTIVPKILLYCLWSSDGETVVTVLRSLVILSFMGIGYRAWLLAASGWSLVVMLHLF